MRKPTAACVDAPYKDGCEAVMEASGQGPGCFSAIRLTTDNPPTPTSPIVAYAMNDGSATSEKVAQWEEAASGLRLPELMPGKYWGEDGVISAIEGLTATSHMTTLSGINHEGEALLNALLHTKGWYVIPPEPL